MPRLDRMMAEFTRNVYGDDLGEPDLADRPVFVLDNGASEIISDTPAIYPSELPPSTEDIDLEREASVGRAAEDVLGAMMGETVRGRSENPYRDDFVDRIRQMALAAVGPNGEEIDEFHQKWALQNGQHAALAEVAPFTRITPPSALKGILGGTVPVAPGQIVSCARWDADSDTESMPVTVTIAGIADIFSSGAAAAAYRPFAILKWGTRGNLTQAELDIGRGRQLTVNASAVELSFALENNIAASSQPLQLTGMLSFMPCVRTAPIVRTIYVSLGSGATSTIQAIPMFATRVSLYRNDATQAVTANFFNAGGGQPRLSFLRAAAGQAAEQTTMDPLALPGEVGLFTITNGGGSAVLVAVEFELSL